MLKKLIFLTLLIICFENSSIFAFKTDTTDAALPGSARRVYLPEQDSAFQKALDMQLPFSLRARLDLELSEPLWRYLVSENSKNPWISALRSLEQMPEGAYIPSEVERTLREINIMNSMYVPFVRTYSPYGAKIDFETIGKFLGIVEDVSPTIKYTLAITADVEIVIYSIQAIAVATLFKGVQSPGNYTISWNGRDENGRMMPPGDYIAEVRIGQEKYVRKRIVLK
ncbi:MAG: FlgD immunoglobulin-like domain containing protein [Bacteroidota bacterium]